ncbi:MAG TPA: EpsI family protein [Armatimonadota bacterium]|jgi:EpsI family protein
MRSSAAIIQPARYLILVVLFLLTIPLLKAAERSQAPDTFARPVGLKGLPRQVGEWSGKDGELDQMSLDLLKPDDYLWRMYQDPRGVPLDFLVVYGHLKQTFHSPGFCLPGGGWQISAKSETPVNSDGLPMQMNVFDISREYQGQTLKQVVLYCFMQGDHATPSIYAHNWNLLKARVQRKRATGALVRVIVPVVTTEEAAVAEAKYFIIRIYPDLRKRIG